MTRWRRRRASINKPYVRLEREPLNSTGDPPTSLISSPAVSYQQHGDRSIVNLVEASDRDCSNGPDPVVTPVPDSVVRGLSTDNAADRTERDVDGVKPTGRPQTFALPPVDYDDGGLVIFEEHRFSTTTL